MIVWLRRGIASPLKFACLLCGFLVFPFVVKWTDAFSIARIDANSPEHTPAFLKFAAILLLFEWTWFFIAWVGICKYGKVSFTQLIGGKWNRWSEIFRDLGLGLLTFAILLMTGAFLQQLLARFQNDSTVMRSMSPQNSVEATAFMALALTAGFVEEFVFRGYLHAVHSDHRECGCSVDPSAFAIHTGTLFPGLASAYPCRRNRIASNPGSTVEKELKAWNHRSCVGRRTWKHSLLAEAFVA
jgi:membrane protease YdiL (CAAX protease family)